MIRKIPFDPRRIGSLALWLDAADATSAGAWPDRSGYQRHAMQAATNSQPALSGTINGRPALSFDGINDNLAVPPIPMVSCGIVAVCQPSASSRTLAFIAANGSPSFFVPSGDASLAAFVQGNGGAVQSPGAEPSWVDCRIGAAWSSGSLNSFFQGLIGEVLVYSTALTYQQTTRVIDYLKQKWAL